MRVGQMVRHVVANCSGLMHAARLAAVVKVVEAIIICGRLTPARIGRNLRGPALPKHGIKCVDRLLGNSALADERLLLFGVIAQHLLRGCPRPVILVDWTQVAGTHEALVAAVPIGGRAVPVYLEVHPLKKLGNTAVEKCFLRRLASIVPTTSVPVIVSDAGFKGPFFQAIRALGWDFLGRVRGTATARPAVGGDAVSKVQLYARASTRAHDLGAFLLFTRQRIPCRLVLIRKPRKPGRRPPPPKCKEERELRQAALDPWLLATSVDDATAEQIVRMYAKRMQIEETFRDAKSHRFGWSLGDVRIECVKRAATLLLLAVVALLVMLLIGMAAEGRRLQRAYQANTASKRVLSFFNLAAAIINRAVDRIARGDFSSALASIPRLAHA
jgi:DDE family transposase